MSSQTAEDHLEWCGLVESKVRYLINNLERNQHISLAHVNPKCFDHKTAQPSKPDESVEKSDANGTAENGVAKHGVNAPHCSMWFIGLEFERAENLNVDLTESIQQFTYSVHKHAVSSSIAFESFAESNETQDTLLILIVFLSLAGQY